MDSLQRKEGGCKHIYRPIVAGPWVPIVLIWPARAEAEVWWCTQSQRGICLSIEYFFISKSSWEFSTSLRDVKLWGASDGWVSADGEFLGLSSLWPGAMVTTHSANMFSYSAWWEFKGFWPYMASLRRFICITLIEKLSLYKCSWALHASLSA